MRKSRKVLLLLCLMVSIFLIPSYAAMAKQTNSTSSSANVDGTWRHNANGWWYQYANGRHAANTWVKDGDKWYYFNERGLMVTGWKRIDNHWYYFQPSGQMTTEWKKISGKWYYFGNNGVMVNGWKQINGKWYCFAGGVMRTGWYRVRTNSSVESYVWYYFGSDGSMRTGWQKLNNHWYYFDGNGVMASDWKKIKDHWYYFGNVNDHEGMMRTGWQTISAEYLGNGRWTCNKSIKARRFYFEPSGALTESGWKKLNGKWYYFNTMRDSDTYSAHTGLLENDGKYYYLSPSDCTMCVGEQSVDKYPWATFIFDKHGVLTHIKYGHYEQDNQSSNGAEPILWKLLKTDSYGFVLTSEYVLDARDREIDDSGRHDSLEEWLNSDFRDAAFTEDEQSHIYTQTYSNDPARIQVKSLTVSTALECFVNYDGTHDNLPGDQRKCKPTPYALSKGIEVEDGYCDYWLKHDTSPTQRTGMTYGGFITVFSRDYTIGVRPMITLKK